MANQKYQEIKQLSGAQATGHHRTAGGGHVMYNGVQDYEGPLVFDGTGIGSPAFFSYGHVLFNCMNDDSTAFMYANIQLQWNPFNSSDGGHSVAGYTGPNGRFYGPFESLETIGGFFVEAWIGEHPQNHGGTGVDATPWGTIVQYRNNFDGYLKDEFPMNVWSVKRHMPKGTYTAELFVHANQQFGFTAYPGAFTAGLHFDSGGSFGAIVFDNSVDSLPINGNVGVELG